MSDLTVALAKVEGEHAAALSWFRDHRGETISWSEIKDQAEKGARLVTQAKGIYKPRYTDYALSVRQLLYSPYADKEVVKRLDGSWVYPYFQENPNPAERDREATNRGLVKCMNDGVPVGVLLQSNRNPGSITPSSASPQSRNRKMAISFSRGSRTKGIETRERPD